MADLHQNRAISTVPLRSRQKKRCSALGGFPRQRVAVSHCVAGVPPVIASGATRRGVPLASQEKHTGTRSGISCFSLFPKSWERNLVPETWGANSVRPIEGRPIEGRAVRRRGQSRNEFRRTPRCCSDCRRLEATASRSDRH